ncbi:MAG: PH domain-containing protein [Microbacterium sp.]
MTSSDQETHDSRPRIFRAWTGIVFLAIAVLAAVFLLGDAVARAGFEQMLLLAPWVLFALWVIYAASAASVLRVSDQGVVVQNLLRRTTFGWSHVKDVDFRWQLEFLLDNGATVAAMGGPARSRPRRQTKQELEVEGKKAPSGVRELADIRDRWKTAPSDADAPVRRSWDWAALGALAVLIVWAAIAVAITR